MNTNDNIPQLKDPIAMSDPNRPLVHEERTQSGDNRLAKTIMPEQQSCFTQKIDGHSVEVLRIYDLRFAREVFNSMDDGAQSVLRNELGMDETFDPEAPVSEAEQESSNLLWEELIRTASDISTVPCFFVVVEDYRKGRQSHYISSDRTSAEDFARALLPDQALTISR